MVDQQAAVLILESDDLRRQLVCRKLRTGSRVPPIIRAELLSEALRILNARPVELFVCERMALTRQTDQIFRILLSRYPATHLLFLSDGTRLAVGSALEGHPRVRFIDTVDLVPDALHTWGLGRPPAATRRAETSSPVAATRVPEPEACLETRDLTPRQNEIMQALSQGMSNKEIARRLGIRETTVKVQLKLIYRVLQVSNRTQAAVMLARRQKNAERRAPVGWSEAWQGPQLAGALAMFMPQGALSGLRFGRDPSD